MFIAEKGGVEWEGLFSEGYITNGKLYMYMYILISYIVHVTLIEQQSDNNLT